MALTPYDTGVRAEPKPWVYQTLASGWITGSENARHSVDDDFGRVDFDDDEGFTVATIWLERNEHSGQYVVHIEKHVPLGLRIIQED